MNTIRIRSIRPLWSLYLCVIALCSCAAPKETRYYLLDYVPVQNAERKALGPWPYQVRIKDFIVAEAYRRNEIVYRQSPHEIRYYNYELWAVRPEFLITDKVYQHLRQVNLFRSITRTIEEEEGDYILTGEVTALEEYDNEDFWYAHLAMSMQLEDAKTGQNVWQGQWDYRKKVLQQEPVFVVRDLSLLLERVVSEATRSIDSLFQARQ